MLETICTPGAISIVTSVVTGPRTMATMVPGNTLRALIFMGMLLKDVDSSGFRYIHFETTIRQRHPALPKGIHPASGNSLYKLEYFDIPPLPIKKRDAREDPPDPYPDPRPGRRPVLCLACSGRDGFRRRQPDQCVQGHRATVRSGQPGHQGAVQLRGLRRAAAEDRQGRAGRRVCQRRPGNHGSGPGTEPGEAFATARLR